MTFVHHRKIRLVQRLILQVLFKDQRRRTLPQFAAAQYFGTFGGGHHYCIIDLN